MDLTLNRRADYAVRAALYLAHAWDEDRGMAGFRKIREVAQAMDLPISYTPRVLATLARAGVAEAKAGRQGGYRLIRSPRDITLLEIVEAAEGPLAPERCTIRGGPCHWDDVCALHPAWSRASDALRGALEATSLADIAWVDRSLAEGSFPTPANSHRLPRLKRSTPAGSVPPTR